MNKIHCPIPFKFAVGETFAPPPFLWEIEDDTQCPPVCTPVNLTGFTAAFTAKQSSESLLLPDILATTQNGMIQIDGILGSIQLILPSWYTAEIVPFCGFWDLWVFSPPYSTVATRLFGGEIEVFLAVGSP